MRRAAVFNSMGAFSGFQEKVDPGAFFVIVKAASSLSTGTWISP
jgi:hypothetical protein